MRHAMAALLLSTSVSAQAPQPAAQQGRDSTGVISPEITAEKKIVFRVLAPNAQSVRLVG